MLFATFFPRQIRPRSGTQSGPVIPKVCPLAQPTKNSALETEMDFSVLQFRLRVLW